MTGALWNPGFQTFGGWGMVGTRSRRPDHTPPPLYRPSRGALGPYPPTLVQTSHSQQWSHIHSRYADCYTSVTYRLHFLAAPSMCPGHLGHTQHASGSSTSTRQHAVILSATQLKRSRSQVHTPCRAAWIMRLARRRHANFLATAAKYTGKLIAHSEPVLRQHAKCPWIYC